MKRRGSSVHQLVQRIPADVAGKVRGMKLAIPIGDAAVAMTITAEDVDVRASLRSSRSTVDQWRKPCETFVGFLGKDAPDRS